MRKSSLLTYKLLVVLLLLAVFGSVLLRLGYGYDQPTVEPAQPINPQPEFSEKPLSGPLNFPGLRTTSRVGVGVYLGGDEDLSLARTMAFEQLLDLKLRYKLMFIAWGQENNYFPANHIADLKKLGLTPLITWEPWERNFKNPEKIQPKYSLKSIADGAHDAYLQEWAAAAAAQNTEIIIRFGHEMTAKVGDQNWYPWQGDPANYKKAFRHIVEVFRAAGATKVRFLWNPIFYGDIDNSDIYYPGNEYVDYIGLTMINLGNLKGVDGTNYTWLDCDYIFDFEHKPVAKYSKPIIIAEILTTDHGGNKAEWFSQCFNRIEKTRNIVGMVFYHSNIATERWSLTPIDWKITTNPRTLRQIKASIIKYFGP